MGSAPRMMFSATVKDGASLKCWCTIPMPAAIACAGAGERHRRPAQANVAAVAREEPVEDVHERRLAGAVFADQRMNFAGSHPERRIVDGDEIAEPFHDVHHADDVAARGHALVLPLARAGVRRPPCLDAQLFGVRNRRRRRHRRRAHLFGPGLRSK